MGMGNLTSKNITMKLLATTRMSSKGQVVIPEEIRERLHLAAGSQFVVIGEGDAIIFKTLKAPSMKDFDGLIQRARTQAKFAGIKSADIAKAVVTVRRGE
jgi:AbrB family looped-hinge helix DNA binding protein